MSDDRSLSLRLLDSDGADGGASQMLDRHHPIIGDDEEPTYCVACGFAVGWIQPTEGSGESYGHSTQATESDVSAWMAGVSW